jgi:hypothetical protein
MATQSKSPGVYIGEPHSFPLSIVAADTAIPAFIGYTETATDLSKDLVFTPVRITSMADYQAWFGGAFDQTHYLALAAAPVPPADSAIGGVRLGDADYSLWRMGGADYNLYQSLRLFYLNGGRDCYVVSCGLFGGGAAPPAISQDDLLKGLDAVADVFGPTLLVIPDAILLDQRAGQDPAAPTHPHFDNVAVAMLRQCLAKEDRFAILDAWMDSTVEPQPSGIDAMAAAFRSGLAAAPPESLRYGAAYFPTLVTSIVDSSEIGLANFDRSPANLATLTAALEAAALETYPDTGPGTPDPRYTHMVSTIAGIGTASVDPSTLSGLSRELAAGLPPFQALLETIAASLNLLPASGAIAGLYAFIDGQRGVWNAPAGIGVAAAVRTSVSIGEADQEGLNVPVDGLAIDAIRSWPGRGTQVWGARTLDGNSQDWRYIQTSRTAIYIAQSIKQALSRLVFEPNTAQTWAIAVSMVESFLKGLWEEGGLMGANAAEAFNVGCGLGTTMTSDDVLNGLLRVSVQVAIVHPAEYIMLVLTQEMAGGA